MKNVQYTCTGLYNATKHLHLHNTLGHLVPGPKMCQITHDNELEPLSLGYSILTVSVYWCIICVVICKQGIPCLRYIIVHSACQWEKFLKCEKKKIFHISQTCGLEMSTGQTQIVLATGHQTIANFKHSSKLFHKTTTLKCINFFW